MLGVGFYTYNAFPVFALAAGAVLALALVTERPFLKGVLRVATVPLAAAVVALPLLLYAFDDENDYLDHHRFVAVSESQEW
jgi:ABC-type transport system involved in cytochrome c biogenesis permease subunit